tara:strand:+ start:33662 stop:35011 length:1350 start_codon:yes stop_codon:yes gene_type:complete
MLKQLALSGLVLLSLGANAQTRSLEDRVAELEAAQSLNIFKFSGAFITQYDHIEGKQSKTGTSFAAYDDKVDFMRLLTYLNVDADVSSHVKFYSRYTVSKFFNSIVNQTGSSLNFRTTDLGVSRGYTGSQVYLERAYADIKVADSNFILSAGRLSTIEGPPNHLANGKSRMGTYPALVYNVTLDGAALTHSYDMSGSAITTRLIYSPLTTVVSGLTNGVPNYQAQPTTNGNGTSGDKLPSSNAVTSWMLEYNSKDMGSFGNFTAIYQGLTVNGLAVNGYQVNAAATGRTVSSYNVHSLTLDMANIAKSNVDLGLSVLSSEMKSEGAISIGGTPAVFGYGASAENDKVNSTTTLASLRYKYASNDFVGYEYLSGGRGNFIFDMGAEDLTNFQATPGTASNVYLLHKFTPELGLRVGYRTQEYKYSALTIGPTVELDRKVNTAYANLRLDF